MNAILPRRLPKQKKRDSRWRSQAHCTFVRSHACSIPGCVGMPIEVAHVRIGSGAGIGQKPDDFCTVSLCKDHHQQQHTIGERSFWDTYKLASGQTVEELIEAFSNASPKAADIRRVKKEREVGA